MHFPMFALYFTLPPLWCQLLLACASLVVFDAGGSLCLSARRSLIPRTWSAHRLPCRQVNQHTVKLDCFLLTHSGLPISFYGMVFPSGCLWSCTRRRSTSFILYLGHGLRVDFHVGRSISIIFLSLIVSVDSLDFCLSLFLWDGLTEWLLVVYCLILHEEQYLATVDFHVLIYMV